MAISKALQELLEQIQDPADREAQRALLEKHATVFQDRFEGNLRQSDYDRYMNENKKIVEWANGEGATAVEKANKNAKLWEQEHTRAEELEKKLTEMTSKAATEAGIDPATLETRVTEMILKNPHLTLDGIQKLIDTQAVTLQKRFMEETLPNSLNFMTDMVDVQMRYKDEFGQRLDRKAFSKFMIDNQIADPSKAYEAFVSNDVKKMEIDQAKKDAVAEYLKNNATQNMPGSGVHPSGESGAVVQMIHRKDGANDHGASAAAAALAAAGKG